MQKHLREIAQIIERSRYEDELILLDSKAAAEKIVAYLAYHFEVKEKVKIDPVIELVTV